MMLFFSFRKREVFLSNCRIVEFREKEPLRISRKRGPFVWKKSCQFGSNSELFRRTHERSQILLKLYPKTKKGKRNRERESKKKFCSRKMRSFEKKDPFFFRPIFFLRAIFSLFFFFLFCFCFLFLIFFVDFFLSKIL